MMKEEIFYFGERTLYRDLADGSIKRKVISSILFRSFVAKG